MQYSYEFGEGDSTPLSLSLPLILGLLSGAASAAHGPRGDICEDGESEGDNQEDADCEGLVAERSLDSVDAVLGRHSIVNGLEVEEEAWVAHSIAI